MKVLLCQSYLGSSLAPLVFPLGLAYIASAIKDKHEVYCWDSNVAEDPMNEFPKILEKIQPQVVGLSLRNVDSALSATHEWYYPIFVSMLNLVRNKLPGAKIVVGGVGFSLFAEEIMKRNPEIDFGVVFEGEQAFAHLLENMDHPEKINNIVFRKNGKIFFTDRKSIEKFDDVAFPAREFFDIKSYKKKKYSANVATRRGCGFHCIFCPNNFLSGYNYRVRSPKKVVDEIEILKNDFDIDTYFFADTTFNYPFDYAEKICQELITRKLDTNWMADFHASYINESFMRQAVKSGCTQFIFSPDGATDNSLAYLKKGIKLNDIVKTINLVKKVEDARVCYNFMYDLPKHNSENTMGIIKLIHKMEYTLREKISGVYITKMRIYPHSELYDVAIKQKIITPQTNMLYPIHYSALNNSKYVENALGNLCSKTCFMVSKMKSLLVS